MAIRHLREQRGNQNHADSANGLIRLPRPDVRMGTLLAIAFRVQGTTVGTTAAADDAVARLLSEIRVTLKTLFGNYVATISGRDAHLLSQYLYRNVPEGTRPSSASAFEDRFVLPLGLPSWIVAAGHRWGVALRALVDEVVVEYTWAAASEYGTGTSSITTGIIDAALVIDDADVSAPGGRLVLLPTVNRIAVESESVHGPIKLGKGSASRLFGLFFRQEDDSAVADRVDGLVTRIKVEHGSTVLVERLFRDFRHEGVSFCGLSLDDVTRASPLGLDGTALYVAAPELYVSQYPALVGQDVQVVLDALETVPNGVTNVTPASGDKCVVTLLGLARGE